MTSISRNYRIILTSFLATLLSWSVNAAEFSPAVLELNEGQEITFSISVQASAWAASDAQTCPDDFWYVNYVLNGINATASFGSQNTNDLELIYLETPIGSGHANTVCSSAASPPAEFEILGYKLQGKTDASEESTEVAYLEYWSESTTDQGFATIRLINGDVPDDNVIFADKFESP